MSIEQFKINQILFQAKGCNFAVLPIVNEQNIVGLISNVRHLKFNYKHVEILAEKKTYRALFIYSFNSDNGALKGYSKKFARKYQQPCLLFKGSDEVLKIIYLDNNISEQSELNEENLLKFFSEVFNEKEIRIGSIWSIHFPNLMLRGFYASKYDFRFEEIDHLNYLEVKKRFSILNSNLEQGAI